MRIAEFQSEIGILETAADHDNTFIERFSKHTGLQELTREVVEQFIGEIKVYSSEKIEVTVADKAEAEAKRLTVEVDCLTSKMDRLYNDRLNGIIDDADFKRVYSTIKTARNTAQERLEKLTTVNNNGQPAFDVGIDELVQEFITSADTNRELLCSLIERVEMSEEKILTIKFRFAPAETICLQYTVFLTVVNDYSPSSIITDLAIIVYCLV